MEAALSVLVPLVFAVSAARAMVTPVKLAVKLAVRAGCGFLCLWLLNTTAFFTGIYLPMNAVTVLIAGFFGLPGIGVIAFLAGM